MVRKLFGYRSVVVVVVVSSFLVHWGHLKNLVVLAEIQLPFVLVLASRVIIGAALLPLAASCRPS
jgi:hypothetical protein